MQNLNNFSNAATAWDYEQQRKLIGFEHTNSICRNGTQMFSAQCQ